MENAKCWPILAPFDQSWLLRHPLSVPCTQVTILLHICSALITFQEILQKLIMKISGTVPKHLHARFRVNPGAQTQDFWVNMPGATGMAQGLISHFPLR